MGEFQEIPLSEFGINQLLILLSQVQLSIDLHGLQDQEFF
jgi:hypothetical protein